jgi:uncharacterized protein (TIGR03435 family)
MKKAIISGLILASSIFGQAPQPELEFEAASLRLTAPENANRFGNVTGGLGSTDPERVRYRGTPLSILLAEAYGLPFDQVIAPEWAHTQGYDIVAKIPPGATREQYASMLRNLLIDRLQITSHHEKRNFTAYDLVVAKGGVKMKVSTADPPPPPQPTPGDPAAAAAYVRELFFTGPGRGNDPDGFPALPENNVAAQGSMTGNGHTRINARGQTTANIARTIELGLGGGPSPLAGGGVRVTDKTGLIGRYDFKLEYAGAANIAADDPLPDLITAVQSQLGLKLEKGTAPFDVLVIDHIEKTPTDN